MSANSPRAFLAGCLAGRAALPAPSWDPFFALASAEGVLPAVYPSLQGLPILAELPAEVADSLRAVSELNRERNTQIVVQAQTIVAALNDAGIQPVALKGIAYLLAGVFPDPASRYLLDLDFLVPEGHIPVALTVLAGLGYTPNTEDSLVQFRHHAPQLRRLGCVPVELHHALCTGSDARLLPAVEVIAESSILDWQGVQIRLPKPEHLATHLVLHSQVQHTYRERVWPPLRAMYDLMLLDRRYGASLNWPSIEKRLRTTLQLHLLQVQVDLGMQLPTPVRLSLLGRLRWMRRCSLNRFPKLRLIDPVYLVMSALSRRFRLLRAILSTPGGWKQATQMLLQPGFYHRLLSDV